MMDEKLAVQSLERLIVSAYVRGFQWCVENGHDFGYIDKAASDYADKALSVIEVIRLRSQVSPVVAEGWQDISTAPKDGTRFLGYTDAGDLAPNEMRWKFRHEDDADARLVISRNRKFNSAGHDQACFLLKEVIEDWAWNEPGQWDREGTDFDVIVLEPVNIAGDWKVRVFATPCVIAERAGRGHGGTDG